MASLEDYDEFGNYIGADLESDDEDVEPSYDFAAPSAPPGPSGGAAPLEGFDDEPVTGAGALMEVDGTLPFLFLGEVCKLKAETTEPVHNAVILHEDKQYYPSASDVYGQDVETLVQEEDAQPLTEPIIAPVKVRKWTVEEKDLPETRFDKGYAIPYSWHDTGRLTHTSDFC
jgi:U5 small nuclear ribonucleoprotein component